MARGSAGKGSARKARKPSHAKKGSPQKPGAQKRRRGKGDPTGAVDGRSAGSAETRNRILHAAGDLFAMKGYRGATIREICSNAGVELPTLYWYFGSKSALLAAVVEEVGRYWVDRVREASAIASQGQQDVLPALDVFRTILEERPDVLRLPPSLMLQAEDLPQEVLTALRRLWGYAVEQTTAFTESLLGRPLPDADLAAQTAIVLLYGAMMWKNIQPDTDMERFWADYRRTIQLIVADRLVRGG